MFRRSVNLVTKDGNEGAELWATVDRIMIDYRGMVNYRNKHAVTTVSLFVGIRDDDSYFNNISEIVIPYASIAQSIFEEAMLCFQGREFLEVFDNSMNSENIGRFAPFAKAFHAELSAHIGVIEIEVNN